MEELKKQIGKVTNNLLQDILNRFKDKVIYKPVGLNENTIYTFKYLNGELGYEASTLGTYKIPYYTGVGFANSILTYKGSKIGIDVNEPTATLDVNGSIKVNVDKITGEEERGSFNYYLVTDENGNVKRGTIDLAETLDSVTKRGNNTSRKSIIIGDGNVVADDTPHIGRICVDKETSSYSWGGYIPKNGNNYNIVIGMSNMYKSEFTGGFNTSIGHYAFGSLVRGLNNVALGYSAGFNLVEAEHSTLIGIQAMTQAKNIRYCTVVGSYNNYSFTEEGVSVNDLTSVSPVYNIIKSAGWLKTLYEYDENKATIPITGVTTFGSYIHPFRTSPTRGLGTIRIGFNQGNQEVYRDYNNICIGSNIFSHIGQHQTHNSLIIGNFLKHDEPITDSKLAIHISKNEVTNVTDSLIYGDFTERWFKLNGQLKLDLNRTYDATNDITIEKELVVKSDGTIATRPIKPETVVQVPDKVEIGYFTGGNSGSSVMIYPKQKREIYADDEQMLKVKSAMALYRERDLVGTNASNWSFYTLPEYKNGEPLFEFFGGGIFQKKSDLVKQTPVCNYRLKVPLPIRGVDWQIRFDMPMAMHYGAYGTGMWIMGFTDSDRDDNLVINNPIMSNILNRQQIELCKSGKTMDLSNKTMDFSVIITKYADLINVTIFHEGKETSINREIVVDNDSTNLYFTAVFEGFNNNNQNPVTHIDYFHKIKNFRYYINRTPVTINYEGKFKILEKLSEVKKRLRDTSLQPFDSSNWMLVKTNPTNQSVLTSNGIVLSGGAMDNGLNLDALISIGYMKNSLPINNNSEEVYVYRFSGTVGNIRAIYGCTGVLGFLNDNEVNGDSLNVPNYLAHLETASTGNQYISYKFNPDKDNFSITELPIGSVLEYNMYCFDRYIVFEMINNGEVVRQSIIDKNEIVGVKPFVAFFKFRNEYRNTATCTFGEYANIRL